MLLDAEAGRKAVEELHPDIVEWMKTNGNPAMDWTNLEQLRKDMNAISDQSRVLLLDPNITETKIKIPMRDGYQSTLKIHKATGAPTQGSPLVIHIFGGGFMGGDEDQGTAIGRAWVRLFNATVVTPSYRLAPEHKFPTSQHDAWDAIAWLDVHSREIGADLTAGFIVAGSSAGGCCASAVCTYAIEHPLKHKITGQLLHAPTLMTKESVPDKYKKYFNSHDQCHNTLVLNTSHLDIIAKATEQDERSPWRYPVYSSAPSSKQPKAVFLINGADPLRDEGLIWEEMLKEAGVETKLEFYPGCPHAHGAYFPGVNVSFKAAGDLVMGIGWLLGHEIIFERAIQGIMGPLPAA